jgi:pilus assembly protein Flp/PilA
MRDMFLKLYVKGQVLRSTLVDENGQDLVEYALVCALVALGAVTGMRTLANGINAAFSSLSTTLGSDV